MKYKQYIGFIFILFILSACISFDEPNIDEPNTDEPNTDEPTLPEDIETPPEEQSTFNIQLEGLDHLTSIDNKILSNHELKTIETNLEFGMKEQYIGYNLMELVYNSGNEIHHIFIESEEENIYVSLDLKDVFLFVGRLYDDRVETFEEDAYFIGRMINKELVHQIINPLKISFSETQEEKTMYYIKYSSVPGRYDAHTSLRAVQGIINRQTPKLLTISTGNPFYKNTDLEWLYVIESKGYHLIELTSLEEVIFVFKDYFEGVITFRDNLKSYNNWVSAESDLALMMASLKNYVPITFGLHHTIISMTGLKLIDAFEVNGKEVNGNITEYLKSNNIIDAFGVYDHVFKNFKEAFNTKSYMSLTSEVMDYAASERMMFFDLKATQNQRDNILSKEINAYFNGLNDVFYVYGWVDHESSALDFISSYGGVIDVVGSGNLSLLHRLHIENKDGFKQTATYQTTYDPNKKYVTFFASEGDTIKVGIAFQHGAWLDPNRGKVPINWGLIADMSVEFPLVYDHYFKTATHNDYFYSGGGSAIGFVDIDSQMPLDSRIAIAKENAHVMAIGDQHIIDMYNDRYTSTDVFEKHVIGNYLNQSEVFGSFARIHDGNTSIRVETFDSIPVYNRWTNFYPRRGATIEVLTSQMVTKSLHHYVQSKTSNYWFIETNLTYTQAKHGFELFSQPNGDGYQVTFENGMLTLSVTIGDEIFILDSKVFDLSSKRVKMIIDKATPYDQYTKITLYVNDVLVIEYYDHLNHFVQGGFGLFSELGVIETFKDLKGTKYSQAQSIYRRIISDEHRFIVAYYGFVGGTNHTQSMYRSEPGMNAVISLSPTDFYKIQLLLEQSHPGIYQIVNAHEFLTYAQTYQNQENTLR